MLRAQVFIYTFVKTSVYPGRCCLRSVGWAGVGLVWAGVGWAGLGWAGLGWAGLGWAGLGWAGLGWALLSGFAWFGLAGPSLKRKSQVFRLGSPGHHPDHGKPRAAAGEGRPGRGTRAGLGAPPDARVRVLGFSSAYSQVARLREKVFSPKTT